jgi:hypothetical protein
MRLSRLLLISFLSLPCLYAQESDQKYSLFGCSENAVEVSTSKKPPLRFVRLDHPPADIAYGNEHRFVFHERRPFDTIFIYFTADLGESQVGRGSSAGLGIYAEFTISDNVRRSVEDQWWKIESTLSKPAHSVSSESLRFDAERIRGCFEQEGECRFADVALATPDPDIALVAVKFGENLGGANANNWTEASLLLDFRQSPPQVLATADCGYNEGGGACTAIDSGQASRSDLSCEWKGEKQDFLCSEDSSPPGDGHRDSYLLSDDTAPLRVDEVASLAEAISQLRAKGRNASVKVRGVGPVSWIDEIETRSREKVIILGSAEYFYLVREEAGGLKPPLRVEAHPVIDAEQRSLDAVAQPASSVWTPDHGPNFVARRIVKDAALTVLQVVSHENPASQRLYWIGIDARGRADAVQLVGVGSYAGCGRFLEPADVVSTGKIAHPFRASVRFQPPTQTGLDGESLEWEPNSEGEAVSDCIRSGQIVWKDGKFRGMMNDGKCATPGTPKYIRVDDSGRITLSDTLSN